MLLLLACTSTPLDDSASSDSASSDSDAPYTWTEACPVEVAEQRMVDVGEVSLNVACRGDGPVVVFLHGFPEWHHAWNPVMDELATEYRLIAPDQRGYNLSDKPSDLQDYALPKLVADIQALLPIVSDEPVLLVAHDWGGPVGWLVAHDNTSHVRGFMSTNGPHPQRFAELILNDPAQAEASAYMDFFRSEAANDVLTPQVLSTWFPFLSDEDLVLYQAAWGQPDAIKSGLHWHRANDLTIDAAQALLKGTGPVEVPTTVLWGEDDDAVLVQNSTELEAFATDLQVQTFEGVDHWIEHRIPGEVADAVRDLDARAR